MEMSTITNTYTPKKCHINISTPRTRAGFILVGTNMHSIESEHASAIKHTLTYIPT